MAHHSISTQYITKDKIDVTILDMIDPAHFVVKESADLSNASSKARNFLEAEAAMQKYYASLEPCFFQLPLKDAIIVVLHNEKFYRAKVIRILTLSAGHLFRVYLVDYGIECSVPRENIYEIEKDFLHHPFQAVNIELLGLEPISLVMDKITITISYGPVPDWDPSAVIHIRDLQKSMCGAYIEVLGINDLHLCGKLYLCFESSATKCINDELVSKSFARFNEDCWKNITKIEAILENSNKSNDVATTQSKIFKNENPNQVSCIANVSEESEDKGIKMMFINPVDGKIVAESSFSQSNPSALSSVDEKSTLQNKVMPAKEIIPDTCETENKPPSHSEEKVPETEAQLVTQKYFQKLLNKKKYKSPTKDNSADSDNNMTLKDHAIPCEHSQTDISSNKVDSQHTVDNNRLASHSVSVKETDLTISSAGSTNLFTDDQNIACNLINRTLNQSVSSNQSPVSQSSYESRSPSSKTESENVSQAQLIAEKRLMKLQIMKRKSLSPSSMSSANFGAVKTSPTVSAMERNISVDTCAVKVGNQCDGHSLDKTVENSSQNKEEKFNNCLSDSFPSEKCISQTSDEIVTNTPKSSLMQESESVIMSENLKQLQKLQKKMRLKQKRESLEIPEKSSSEFNKYEELSVNVNTSAGSSYDSDSGLNSFSSSSSTSDRIER